MRSKKTISLLDEEDDDDVSKKLFQAGWPTTHAL